MNHIDGYIETTDQHNLHWQCWQPEEKPVASVFILHGVADHSSRFEHVGRAFCAQGIASFAIDLRGHGKSSGTTAFINRFEDYVNDLQDGWIKMKSIFNSIQIPYFLYGHSLGTLIAIHFIYHRKPQLNGLITTAALVKANEDLSPILVKFSSILSVLTPKLKTIKLDLNLLARDKSVQMAALQDPLYHKHGLRARTGSEILKATKPAVDYARKITFPVLIMHGAKDMITKPESSEIFYQNVASVDKSLVIYPDGYHELVNEKNKLEVITTLASWIKGHV